MIVEGREAGGRQVRQLLQHVWHNTLTESERKRFDRWLWIGVLFAAAMNTLTCALLWRP